MRSLLILTLFLSSFVLSSCQKEEPETREKSLSRGFHLMDEGKYDEAISYFAKMAEQDPHYHVKLAWASAYAGRAGIKIENIYSFAISAKKTPPDLKVQGVKFDKQTELLMKSLSGYAQQWNKVPDLSSHGRDDIYSALDILRDKEEPGVRLYGAALRVVLIKSVIQEGVQSWELNAQSRLCGKYLRPMFTWAQKVLDHVASLTVDLEKSFPKQAESFQATRAEVDSLRAQAKTLTLPAEDQCF